MSEFPILRDVGYVIVGAAVLVYVTRPLRVPPILAYMLAGLALGPLLGLLTLSESLELFSELGVALLLFVVGLELSLEKVRDVGRSVLVAGGLQVGLTFLAGWWLALLFGFAPATAAFLGLATSFSSTVVVVKLLDRSGELGTLAGRMSIGILLVQDLLIAVALTIVSGLDGAAGEGLETLAGGLLRAGLGIALLCGVAAAAVRWVLPPVFRWLAESTEALFIASLTWAFLFILGAEAAHVSVELGAFVGGVALAQLPHNEDLRRRIHPLVDFFLAVFFVALGASMDLGAVADFWLAALTLSVFVLLVKPALIAFLLARLGNTDRTAAVVGLTLGQISEFAFVLTALGVSAGIIPEQTLSLVGLVALITIGASAVLVPSAPRIVSALRRRGLLGFLRAPRAAEAVAAGLSGHIVIVGMNTLGRMLVHRFAARGERILAIDTDPEKSRDLPALALAGSADSAAVLQAADIASAKLVVSALQIEDVNSLLAYRCKQLGVPVSIHAFDPSMIDELLEIGADHIIVSKHDGIRQMAEAFRRLGVIS